MRTDLEATCLGPSTSIICGQHDLEAKLASNNCAETSVVMRSSRSSPSPEVTEQGLMACFQPSSTLPTLPSASDTTDTTVSPWSNLGVRQPPTLPTAPNTTYACAPPPPLELTSAMCRRAFGQSKQVEGVFGRVFSMLSSQEFQALDEELELS
jgi:hypothetical protein